LTVNEIIIKKEAAGKRLVYAGFGALANCDCSQSALDPAYFTSPPSTAFVSGNTNINVFNNGGNTTITIRSDIPDSISTVCLPNDGYSKCGLRQITFVDKTTGLTVGTWPYKGFSWSAPILTHNPATAVPGTTILTVKVSLQNWPQV